MAATAAFLVFAPFMPQIRSPDESVETQFGLRA
jgi:hypothetical protein